MPESWRSQRAHDPGQQLSSRLNQPTESAAAYQRDVLLCRGAARNRRYTRLDRVRPSIVPLLATDLRHDHDTLVRHAVRANVRVSANHLRYGSDILQAFIRQRKLLVVGAEYSLETGRVDFFDGLEGATSVVESTP